jgi:hypothetical protein
VILVAVIAIATLFVRYLERLEQQQGKLQA